MIVLTKQVVAFRLKASLQRTDANWQWDQKKKKKEVNDGGATLSMSSKEILHSQTVRREDKKHTGRKSMAYYIPVVTARLHFELVDWNLYRV